MYNMSRRSPPASRMTPGCFRGTGVHQLVGLCGHGATTFPDAQKKGPIDVRSAP